mgnify:CR=1 FL=1
MVSGDSDVQRVVCGLTGQRAGLHQLFGEIDGVRGGCEERHARENIQALLCRHGITRAGFVPGRLKTRMTSTPELARLLMSATVVLAWAARDIDPEGETT